MNPAAIYGAGLRRRDRDRSVEERPQHVYQFVSSEGPAVHLRTLVGDEIYTFLLFYRLKPGRNSNSLNSNMYLIAWKGASVWLFNRFAS